MIKYDRAQLSVDTLLQLYRALLKPRLIEEKMLVLLRQNKVSKWFSGIGQEAIAVGVTEALNKEEYILPMHRNLGVFTSRNIPLNRLFAQFQGKLAGYTKGRDRSFHFASKEHHLFGMISHLGPQLTVANGIAMADKIAGNKKVTLAFSGDGGASEGDFHEALNVAAVWSLPVIFLVENNGYGLSTPNNEQFKCKSFIDKGPGYGIEAIQIDGNNILEVYTTIKSLAESIRKNPRPVLIEAITFRMRGHEEASGTKYVPQEMFDTWSKLDPVENFETYLLQENILDEKIIADYHKEIKKEIEQALEFADAESFPIANAANEIKDMYYPFTQVVKEPSLSEVHEKRYLNAISEALMQSMERYPELVLMGQDIAEYGGVFKVTEGFVEKFGKDRVRNTPLCESAIVGAGLGLSIKGGKSVVEMQFADFVTMAFNQIINNLAKVHYRTGLNADVVIRMPTGAGSAAGPFHSQSNEAWFFHTPGLKVVYPSNPHDAKGLLNAAIEDPNPVMYFEHKLLYRSITAPIPSAYYTTAIGKAVTLIEGNNLTVITYGMCVHWVQDIIKEQPGLGIELIDLRTLLPWDKETVYNSVKKTGKALVVNEDTLIGSISAEIAASISENCFAFLDAPVMREGSLETAIPFSPTLEACFLPKERIKEKIIALLEF
jgi:2-oxoisovalerate dehydrogenase E1 component